MRLIKRFHALMAGAAMVAAVSLMFAPVGCGTNLADALLQAVAAVGRTQVDGFLTDVANDIAESEQPDDMDPADDEEPDSDGDDANIDDGDIPADAGNGDAIDGGLEEPTGDAANGETLFASLNCATCHCADASGGCALEAPALVSSDVLTLDDFLRQDAAHPGGKQDVTDQEIADFAAYLASLGGG